MNEILALNDLKTKSTSSYHASLGSTLDALQTSQKIQAANNYFEQSFDRTNLSLKNYSFVITSIIYDLYSHVAIANLNNTKFTPHYQKYRQIFGYIELDKELKNDLLYTQRKTWATKYGSIGYSLNLSNNINYSTAENFHYLFPNQLVYYVINNSFEYSKQFGNTVLNSILDKHLKYLQSERIDKFYLLTEEIEAAFGDLKLLFQLFDFLETTYVEIIQCYKANRVTNKETFNEIKKLALIAIRKGIDETAFTDLKNKFILQDYPVMYFELFRELINSRKIIDSAIISSQLDSNILENRLYQKFISDFPSNIDLNIFKQSSVNWLQQVFPPGGYNFLLILVALAMLGAAYNLAFNNQNIAINDSRFASFSGQINKFTYLGGASLKQSNLNYLQTVGDNLIILSQYSN